MVDATYAIRQQALKFLARREYSRSELQRKLMRKGWEAAPISAVLSDLAAEQLQSDERFLASYIRYRGSAGYGPRRILAELAERGIKEISEQMAHENSEYWLDALKKTWQKKFRGQRPQDLKTRVLQARFLVYRGFTPEQVHHFLNEV